MSLRKLDTYCNVISENLKKFRTEKEYSQADLAKELNLLGINMHKNDIQLIEANKRTVKDFEIWGLMKVFNVTFEQLIEGIESKI